MATITFRTDPEVDAALSALVGDGRDRSRAIREAIIEAARRERAARLRAEADALAADPADRAEARAVLEDLESLRAW
jgi:Arc/MetJ-type ribon-helix-helix transcriptional regulator